MNEQIEQLTKRIDQMRAEDRRCFLMMSAKNYANLQKITEPRITTLEEERDQLILAAAHAEER